MTLLAALDIETTGLDPTADKTLAEELAQLKGRLQVEVHR